MAGIRVVSPSDPVIPRALPWVTGRFYNSFLSNGSTSAAALSTPMVAMPFLVPKQITITSIGIEITGAAVAGATYRLALYSDTGSGFPNKLIKDCGTVALDATGFNSASISQLVNAGILWAAGAPSVTGASARTISSNPFHFSNLADTNNLTLVGYTDFFFSGMGPGIAANGFPEYFFQAGQNTGTFAIAAGNVPRIMLGV